MIEVSDTTIRRDRYKLSLYARAGVAELWIEDLRKDTIFAYREPVGDSYRVEEQVHRGDRIAPAAFPDLTLKVDDLIA